MSSVIPTRSFSNGDELPVPLSAKDIESLQVPSEFFGASIPMQHHGNPSSRFTASLNGQSVTSGAIPINVEYLFTDVGDFRSHLKIENDHLFGTVDTNECGSVEVSLENSPTGASINTRWHGSEPSLDNRTLKFRYGPRGFEASYSVGKFPGKLTKISHASGREIKLQSSRSRTTKKGASEKMSLPVSVDIVARLTIPDEIIDTFMKEVAVKQEEQRMKDMVDSLLDGR